jgi:release factor glutamine methyltransferase
VSPALTHRPVEDATSLGAALAWAVDALAETSDSPRLDAELLLAHATGVARSTLRAFGERPIAAAERDAFEALIQRRRDAVPVAYLLGRREFHAITLEVGPEVLVPRPETELIVDAALERLPAEASAAVLDLGTGSGAIALAIKHARPRVRLAACDVSPAALDLARRNAARLGLAIEWTLSDWFDAFAARRFDLIVANPPYVASADAALAGPLRHEPRGALDGGPDGLAAIRRIVADARTYLSAGATLLVEHGDTQAAAARALAGECGYHSVATLTDLAGRERVLVASAP